MLDMADRKPKKKPTDAGRSPRPGRHVNVWVRSDLGEVLDAHLERDRPKPTLTALIEAALEAYFRSHPLPPAG